jgi:NAD+ diphosphatase
MIGCIAEALTSEIRLADQELSDARWFSRAELARALGEAAGGSLSGDPAGGPVGGPMVLLPRRIAIARTLIQAWVAGDA